MPSDIDLFDSLKYRVVVDTYNTRRYFNAAGVVHRDEGPAILRPNGVKMWCQNGKLHRENGPAIEYADGSVLWYLHGKQYSKTRFYQQLNFLKGVSSE